MKIRQEKNSNNTSGFLGVNWSKEKNKWYAKVGFKNRRIHVGYFSTPKKAHEAYLKVKTKLIKGEDIACES